LFFNYLSFVFSASFFLISNFYKINFDAVLCYGTSPITSSLPGIIIGKLKKKPIFLWVLDLWPDTLVDLKILKPGFFLMLIKLIVQYIYNNCTLIFCQSKSFVNTINKNINYKVKTLYLPSWYEEIFIKKKDLKKYKLFSRKKSFNILFAGNIGEAQDFNTIVSCAVRLRKYPDIKWTVIGEGRKYSDFSMMGVGTNILGYSRKEVDDAVRKVIDKGNMSTLNSKEEVDLAEKLISMHPWAEMARFARTGGEVMSIAVRLARAATNKSKIAVCGYHGWHDWYLSANFSNSKNLDEHLMKNISTQGIPKNLKNTTFVFNYNKFDELKKIISEHDLAAVVMEVSRNNIPKNNFLEKIRSITKKKNIVLIFDECTSGFRETFGGLHLKYKINPDLATFGKALGNGYAITAVLGVAPIMNYAKSSFISSTFWTERIGPAAALKTLEVMEKIKSWEIITSIGKKIKKSWLALEDQHKLKLEIEDGIDALPRFHFNSINNLIYKTFISQEFLKKNFLATNAIYACIEHNDILLNKYIDILNSIFLKIKRIDKEKLSPESLLDGPVCQSGLRVKSFK
jgi:glutamate-1-semialdehyde aminotransferase